VTSVPSPLRLPARERRQAIVEAAMDVFSSGSYSGATTAQIARAAGVSEPILYRHFRSKRDLYFACLDEAWARLRAIFEQKLAEHGDADALRVMAQTGTGFREFKARIPNLWVQAITEAGRDEEIRRHLRRHMREVHDFMSAGIRRAQAAGGIPADRDPDAEAWIFIAGGLLASIADRVGGLLSHDDFTAIATQRQRWLLGLE
jgi:AcrR family transcriptional regulator